MNAQPDERGHAEPCGYVVGEQHGEPVLCGAVEAVHGDGLGMASHSFVPNFCWFQWPTVNGDFHRAGDHFCNRQPGHGGRHRCPCTSTTGAHSASPEAAS